MLLVVSAAVVLALAACGGGNNADDVGAPTPTVGPTPTPFSLGNTFTIRGQVVTVPPGVAYINSSPQCQQEATAYTPECETDLKMLVRGDSYILFNLQQERVIARRIEPEDESDFRPLLGIISGTTTVGGPTP